MRPQGAVVAVAADAVARDQKTDENTKRRSFLRLFYLARLFHRQTLGTDTNLIAIPKPSKRRWRRSLSFTYGSRDHRHPARIHASFRTMSDAGIRCA